MILQDQVAIITGAASGVGRAAAIEFARQGARVCVADVDEPGAVETVRQVHSEGGQAFWQRVDISESTQVEAMVQATVERFGSVTILYNNAATTVLCNKEDRSVTELQEWVWDKMLAVCLKGVYLCCKYAIPAIKKAGGGCVLTTSSVDAVLAEPGYDAYTAAKGGVIALTRSMAAEFAADKIRVNCLVPGYVETECQQDWLADAATRRAAESLHLTRLGRPADVARFAAFLAAPQSEYITGGIFPIDGGFSAFKTPSGFVDTKGENNA
jgi:NAD(P)-dependent dehydrogenase (short-subunit alcohol dehydrogenase family)